MHIVGKQSIASQCRPLPSTGTPIEVVVHVSMYQVVRHQPFGIAMQCDAKSVGDGSNVRHACDRVVVCGRWKPSASPCHPPDGRTTEQPPLSSSLAALIQAWRVDGRARVRYGPEAPGCPCLGRDSGSPASSRHSVRPLRRQVTPIPERNRIAHCMSHTHVLASTPSRSRELRLRTMGDRLWRKEGETREKGAERVKSEVRS